MIPPHGLIPRTTNSTLFGPNMTSRITSYHSKNTANRTIISKPSYTPSPDMPILDYIKPHLVIPSPTVSCNDNIEEIKSFVFTSKYRTGRIEASINVALYSAKSDSAVMMNEFMTSFSMKSSNH